MQSLSQTKIDAICMLYSVGMSAREISARANVGLPTIYKYLRREGVPLHGRGRERENRIISPYIERMMAQENLGYDALAYRLGVSPSHIWSVLVGKRVMTATLEYKITQAGWDGARARDEADAWHAAHGGAR